MPTCVVCLTKRDNIPVGGTCSSCNTPPKTRYIHQAVNVKPNKTYIRCILGGQKTRFTTNTSIRGWGTTIDGRQKCWKCTQHSNNLSCCYNRY